MEREKYEKADKSDSVPQARSNVIIKIVEKYLGIKYAE